MCLVPRALVETQALWEHQDCEALRLQLVSKDFQALREKKGIHPMQQSKVLVGTAVQQRPEDLQASRELRAGMDFQACQAHQALQVMVDWVSQVKKGCQDYLAPRAIVEKLVLLALDTQVLVEFVDHQVTLEWMGFQDKQVFQALQVSPCPA